MRLADPSTPTPVRFDPADDHDCREALRHLDRNRRPMDLSELVGALADEDPDADVADMGERYRRLFTAFDHVHCPKLARAGLLYFDRYTRTVTIDDGEERVAGLLAPAPRPDAATGARLAAGE